MTFFDTLVTDYVCSCAGCPMQYEGTLVDGRWFYFRYRYGRASLGIGRTLDDAVSDTREVGTLYGGDWQGVLDEGEFRDLFEELAQEHHAIGLGRTPGH